jgi:hypothetical protein
MIDHVAARRLAATAVDVPLDAGESSELDRHLATCPACRNVSSALARDAAGLRHLDLGPMPIAVRAGVAIAAERGRSGPVGRWGALVVLAALLIVALGGGALGGVGGGKAPDQPAIAAESIDWSTGVMDVRASDLWVEVGDTRFSGAAKAAVKADLDETSRTLEAVWTPPTGVIALRVSVVSIDAHWVVKGLQAWVGNAGDPSIPNVGGRWLDGQGPLIGSEIVAGSLGDVDMDLVDAGGADPNVGATLHIRDLRIVLGATPVPPDQPVPVVPGQPVPQPTTRTP